MGDGPAHHPAAMLPDVDDSPVEPDLQCGTPRSVPLPRPRSADVVGCPTATRREPTPSCRSARSATSSVDDDGRLPSLETPALRVDLAGIRPSTTGTRSATTTGSSRSAKATGSAWAAGRRPSTTVRRYLVTGQVDAGRNRQLAHDTIVTAMTQLRRWGTEADDHRRPGRMGEARPYGRRRADGALRPTVAATDRPPTSVVGVATGVGEVRRALAQSRTADLGEAGRPRSRWSRRRGRPRSSAPTRQVRPAQRDQARGIAILAMQPVHPAVLVVPTIRLVVGDPSGTGPR